MTLVSRILGFVRDVIVASAFGDRMAADAFFVAFKIPNLFRRLFAEGAFSQAFVPVLSESREKEGEDAVRRLVDAATGTLAVVVSGVVLLGVVAAPIFVLLFAPGFVHETAKLELSASLLRVTFPYLLFISLSGLAGSVSNIYGRFGIPALSPVMLNITMIIGAVWVAPYMAEPIMGLAIGVIAGGITQLAMQYAGLWKLGFRPRPRIAFLDPGVRKILRLMGPAIFGVSVAQINMMLDTILASFLKTGSISWLYYADRLCEFPLGVFGLALSTVILPALSERHNAGSAQSFSATLDWGLRWVFVIGTPAAVALAVLAVPLLSTLFEYGKMDHHAVMMSAQALVAFAVGLLPFILVKVLAPAFYARQDTRTPVRIGIISMISSSVMNVILVFPLAHGGLALATSLGAYINSWMLYTTLRREAVYRAGRAWRRFLLQIGVASAVMGLALWFVVAPLDQWERWTMSARALRLSLALVAGTGVYFSCLWLSGLRFRDMAAREHVV
jgi:putative peptidoglycan lipid II flippase